MKRIVMILIISGYQQLGAHSLWIDEGLRVHEGHVSAADHKHGSDDHLVGKQKIASLSCLKNSKVSKVNRSRASSFACDAVYFQLGKQYYTKTPYGTKNLPKNKTKMPITSWQSIESVKRIYNDKADKPFGNGLEIILANKPSLIKVGNKARLVVYFNGKPVEGASVANGHKTVGITDKNGRVNVKIRAKGMQDLKASLTHKGDGVKYDKIIHTTTLNFKVEK